MKSDIYFKIKKFIEYFIKSLSEEEESEYKTKLLIFDLNSLKKMLENRKPKAAFISKMKEKLEYLKDLQIDNLEFLMSLMDHHQDMVKLLSNTVKIVQEILDFFSNPQTIS